jgi:LEA14-like dessication related protein
LPLACFAWFYFFPKNAQNILIPEIDQIKQASIKIKGDTAHTDLLIRFKNKGIFKINIDSLSYKVTFDTLQVLNKMQPLQLVLKPGDIDSMTIPVAIPYKRIIGRIRQLQNRDTTDITTEVRIAYNTIWGKTVLPHKQLHRIGTPIPPKFELDRLEFVRIQDRSIHFNAHLRMINDGNIDLRLSNLKYKFKLKEHLDAEGGHAATIVVKPHSVTKEVLPIEAKFSHVLKAALLVVKDDDLLPYNVVISAMLEGEEGKEPTEIIIKKAGSFELKK